MVVKMYKFDKEKFDSFMDYLLDKIDSCYYREVERAIENFKCEGK